MSNFYLDIIKDRLYCSGEKSEDRRCAQTAMYTILSALARLLAPIMTFTAEEIWTYMPHTSSDNGRSILLNDIPDAVPVSASDAFVAEWDIIALLRDDAKKALEIKRTDKFIGASLEAKIIMNCDEKSYDMLTHLPETLADIFIVSQVELVKGGEGEFKGDFEGVSFTVVRADGGKCERCWKYETSVGGNAEHPTLCGRCAAQIK